VPTLRRRLAFAALCALALFIAPAASSASTQFATVGPDGPLQVPPDGSIICSADKGVVDGIKVLVSDGLVIPLGQCAGVLVGAQVDTDGKALVRVQRGVRGENAWEDVVSGYGSVAMTATHVRPGEGFRLVVTNPNVRQLEIRPGQTQLTVFAFDCLVDERADGRRDRPGLAERRRPHHPTPPATRFTARAGP